MGFSGGRKGNKQKLNIPSVALLPCVLIYGLDVDFCHLSVCKILKSMDSERRYSMGREMIHACWCRHYTLPVQIPLGDRAKQHDFHGFSWTWWDSEHLQPLLCQPLE